MQPTPQDLPEELPILPLTRSLLLPGTLVFLQVTDPRQRGLVEDVLAAEDLLGVVQPVEEKPEDLATAELYEIGCLGHVEETHEREDGGYSLLIKGLMRFRRAEELDHDPKGYRLMRVDYAPFLGDLEEPWEEADFSEVREELRERIAARQVSFDMGILDRVAGADIVNGLSQLFPLSQAERQALLETPTVHDRQTMLLDLMRMGFARLGPYAPEAPS